MSHLHLRAVQVLRGRSSRSNPRVREEIASSERANALLAMT